MKPDKQLLEIFNNATKNKYYSFDNFKSDIKLFSKFFRYRKYSSNNRIVLSCIPSRSGMSRIMNFYPKYINVLVNICIKNKVSFDSMRIGGCGMDMIWNTLYVTCSHLFTTKEMEEWGVNSKCSDYVIL
jgi:hypothetical protein